MAEPTTFEDHNSVRHFYYANGLCFDSCIEFPELSPLGLVPESTDVSINFGSVKESLENPVTKGARYQASPGRFLLQMDGIARFLAKDGEEIVIHPIDGIKASEIRVFLLASVFGALAHQRNLLPLHASAIVHEGEAILFAGNSGAGKSTLAASFRARGYEVLTDDISNITRSKENGKMSVYPGYAQLKLWGNTLRFLDEKTEDHRSLRPHIEKFGMQIPYFNAYEPIPVKAMYVLNIKAGMDPSIEVVDGLKKFNEIVFHTFRQKLIRGLGVRESHFKSVQGFSNEVIVKSVTRNEKINRLPELLELLESDILKLYI